MLCLSQLVTAYLLQHSQTSCHLHPHCHFFCRDRPSVILAEFFPHNYSTHQSASACLLRLWVRIPPGAWTFFCCEYCVCCQVQVSATSRSLIQRSPTDCAASLCVIEKRSEWGSTGPLGAVAPKTNIYPSKNHSALQRVDIHNSISC